MSTLRRREFVGGMAAWVVGPSLIAAGCGRVPSREGVLRSLVQDIVLPDAKLIAEQSRQLEAELSRLTPSPSALALDSVRKSFRRTLLAWQRAHAFRSGPMVDTRALLRTTYWPVREAALATLVTQTRSIDASLIEELGVDLKGLFALEQLLFSGPTATTHWLSAPHGPRALSLAQALAKDVRGHAERGLLGLEEGSFTRSFASAGLDSLNRLVNQIVATVETSAADRLGRALGMHTHHALSLKDIQGGPSGTATDILLTWMTGMERLYLGHEGMGLAVLVRSASPALEASVRKAFARAVSLLRALPKRLEQAVARNPAALEAAVRALKDLEVAIKTDLVSALGVTLSFLSMDGD